MSILVRRRVLIFSKIGIFKIDVIRQFVGGWNGELWAVEVDSCVFYLRSLTAFRDEPFAHFCRNALPGFGL